MTETTAITFVPFSSSRRTICVALVEKDKSFPPAIRALDEQSGGAITRAAGIAKFKGAKKTVADVLTPTGVELDRLVLLGVGDIAKYTETDWLALGGQIRTRLVAARATEADVLLDFGEENAVSGRQAGCVALGAMLRGYEFKKYKKKKKEDEKDEAKLSDLQSMQIVCHQPEEAKAHFEAFEAAGEGVILARDLVNEPANILGPVEFAERVQALQAEGLEVEILDKERLTAIGMNALLAVGQGSERPSAVAVMRWNGARDADEKPIAFVGKGVCFDSGGISIKPPQGMDEMKGDMGGAAAVTGAMLALAKRKAPVNVVGIIGLTENMPSSKATRPGDIITSLSGQTIEVLNTDAEGRLVLADIMWYVQERFEPRTMITLATLTGAILIALGKEHAGLFSNNDELSEQLSDAGKETGEKVWRLPLHAKYNKMMDSKNADMRNISTSRDAGSITAAQFLQRFVKTGVNWAHLDIAGTAAPAPASDICQSWASGYGVRLLDRLAATSFEKK
ncbi:MAG: leucyl aminopeptidase [Alphaproteobacteria bacterium]